MAPFRPIHDSGTSNPSEDRRRLQDEASSHSNSRGHSETFLTQHSHSNFTQSSDLTPLQVQMDGVVSTFIDRTADGYAMLGVVTGGLTSRGLSFGFLKASQPMVRLAPAILSPLARGSAQVAGFVGESIAFHAAPQLARAAFTRDLSLLHLHGEAGMIHGSVTSAVSLLGLRVAGVATAYQSSLVQNFAQCFAIVGSHHAAAFLEIEDKSRESAAFQLMQAESTVITLWAGVSMLHQFAPAIRQSEGAMDLKIQSIQTSSSRPARSGAEEMGWGQRGTTVAVGLGEAGSFSPKLIPTDSYSVGPNNGKPPAKKWVDLALAGTKEAEVQPASLPEPSKPSPEKVTDGDTVAVVRNGNGHDAEHGARNADGNGIHPEQDTLAAHVDTVAPSQPQQPSNIRKALERAADPESSSDTVAMGVRETATFQKLQEGTAEGDTVHQPPVVARNGKGNDNGKHRLENPEDATADQIYFDPAQHLTAIRPSSVRAKPASKPVSTPSASSSDLANQETGVFDKNGQDPKVDGSNGHSEKVADQTAVAGNGYQNQVLEQKQNGANGLVSQPLVRATSSLRSSDFVIKPGKMLANKYQVVRHLGSGGFGEIWQAADVTLDGRRVAIKVLKNTAKTAKEEEEFKEVSARFEREINISSNIESPWTAPVYEKIEVAPGVYGFVMPYIRGHDFSTLIDAFYTGKPEIPGVRERYPLEKLIEMFVDVCNGVEAGHEKGFIHRDLKPKNVRISEQGRVILMDWGLAKHVRDRSPEVREHTAQVDLNLIDNSPQNITRIGDVNGTAGYIAPEVFEGKPHENPKSPDIFALGTILYEAMTGENPFIYVFRERRNAAGGSPKMHPGLSTYVIRTDQLPSLADINPDITRLSHWKEIEAVARKAMAYDSKNRYKTVSELRDAVLLAPAQAEFNRIREIRAEMKTLETQMHEAWNQFDVGAQIKPEQWDRMHEPIDLLVQRRAELHQAAEDLITHLTEIKPSLSQPWLAQKKIAETSWLRLLHGGDRMPQSVRRALMKRIRENDVATREDPLKSMSAALDGKLPVKVKAVDFSSGKLLSESMQLKVVLLEREKDKNGNEQGNYREGATLIIGPISQVKNQINLPAGYYVFEVSHPGYTPMRVPVHIMLKHVREGLIKDQPFNLNLEFVPENQMPPGMVIAHRGTATIGYDFFHGERFPLKMYSFPMKKVSFDTFAVSRDPITVGEYKLFIENQLEQINTLIRNGKENEALDIINKKLRYYIPRAQPKLPKEGSNELKKAFEGINYYWKIVTKNEEKNLRFELVDPTSHKDPNEDPIMLTQPISAIEYAAAEAYRVWRSERDGFSYKIITADQKEIISRNSFPWTYSWGYDFNPTFIASRLVHENLWRAHAHPVGTHPLGPALWRDFSLYGPRDLIGNVGEWTSTPWEHNTFVKSGGSILTAFGTLFDPPSRVYATAMDAVDSNGGIRLIFEFSKGKH
jgi:serine/threonine protein kinase/formylglycine-generating enzyme required for sulfatase activity